MLYYCAVTKEFWNQVQDMLLKIDKDKRINITYNKVLQNNVLENPQQPFNFVVLAAKVYLYSTRCKGAIPNIYEFERTDTKTMNNGL